MLEVSGVYKRYRKKVVLENLSFMAKSGSCVGIVGGNGCGKTTLLSVLSGTLKADGGSICYEGIEAVGHQKVFTDHVAYVPQENPLIEELSARDNLKLWFRGDKKRMEEDLENGTSKMLGISNFLSTPAGKLSGGMKKRLSIACALSNQAPVLIMDEPGAALDLICKEDIRIYLDQYRKGGGTVLITSHELAELSMCDQMYVLRECRLKEISTGLSARELISQFI